MKRQIILISVLLVLTVTGSAGLAFDNKQTSTSKPHGRPQGAGNSICSEIEVFLDKTGRGIEKAGNKTDQALGIAADRTRQALGEAGKKIQDWFCNRPNASN